MGASQVPTDSYGKEEQRWVASIPGGADAASEGVRQRLGRVARQYERVLATVAAEHDLSVGDWEALSVLARSDEGSVTPGRMGEVLGLTSGTVSERIERLVRGGLVEPVEGADGRRRPVRLTAAGAAAWGAATRRRVETEAELLEEALDPGDVATLNTLLGRLLARLEAEFGPAPRHDMTRGRPGGAGSAYGLGRGEVRRAGG
ncbi:MarR family winged helix-turn-helix transcriptional regulator [Arsenicicoccus sp. oral taxon 190]|uniref:MarR family winged helix-turn-helix transcriptional regulator n=1 Tax=Arsenicicoccus sp. oral taxon 190 TaxID=1658671 RepID=UPI0009E4A0DC|nr:helix-turn-helix domain-containing protein [Arsenicicoccus sp. oral taxon 190]